MKPVIVGIAPAREGEEGQPLSCIASQSAGNRMREMVDISRNDWFRLTDRVNVCPFPEKSTIDPKKWRAAAENLGGSILVNRRVVLLGPNVADCFGFPRNGYDFFEWKNPLGGQHICVGWRSGTVPPFSWAVFPHPSGRNRFWNDPENVARGRAFMEELLGV